jgi:acetoacetate decarboxylase
MPLASPAYPPPPDRFLDRVSLTVTYRSDIDKVAALVPEPLDRSRTDRQRRVPIHESAHARRLHEVAQSIGTELHGEPILFRPTMYAGSVAAVLQGRECRGLPKNFGAPMLRLHNNTLVGTLKYSGALVRPGPLTYAGSGVLARWRPRSRLGKYPRQSVRVVRRRWSPSAMKTWARGTVRYLPWWWRTAGDTRPATH